MRRDPIVDEVRAIRNDIAREHDDDLDSIFRMLRSHESSEGPRVKLPPKRLRIREAAHKSVRAARGHIAVGKLRTAVTRRSK